ncbi:MAG: hypothetical protein MJE77_05030 [Proteobacteria bacterium]|nr:hypothetical protein [Pseudomonadota bacterium]
MTIPPCIYDAVNHEIRTVPAFFNNGKVYAGFVRAEGLKIGAQVFPGQVLGALQWEDGTAEPLLAPPGCRGQIDRFGSIKEHRIHRRPSQALLILRPLAGLDDRQA